MSEPTPAPSAIPDRAADDSDVGWGEPPPADDDALDDDRLQSDRPPHHQDRR